MSDEQIVEIAMYSQDPEQIMAAWNACEGNDSVRVELAAEFLYHKIQALGLDVPQQ